MVKRCDHCGSILPEYGGIICDEDRGELRFRGMMVRNLTSQEFNLFQVLFEAKGRILTKEMLLNELYARKVLADAEMPEIKIIDVFICKLRKKLLPLKLEIATVWGRGYYLREPA